MVVSCCQSARHSWFAQATQWCMDTIAVGQATLSSSSLFPDQLSDLSWLWLLFLMGSLNNSHTQCTTMTLLTVAPYHTTTATLYSQARENTSSMYWESKSPSLQCYTAKLSCHFTNTSWILQQNSKSNLTPWKEQPKTKLYIARIWTVV